MYVRLTGQVPPVRASADPAWSQYRIEETPDGGLTVTTIVSATALPSAIVDNANPPSYDLDTNVAVSLTDQFRVVWIDTTSFEVPGEWEAVRQQATWMPQVSDVADYIMSRTKDPTNGGRLAGTFTSNTHPTAAQVARLLNKTTDRVANRMGWDLTGREAQVAGDMAALGAAMMVELNFFAEQINTDQSPYSMYKTQWDDFFGDGTTTGGESEADEGVTASYKFPRAPWECPPHRDRPLEW